MRQTGSNIKSILYCGAITALIAAAQPVSGARAEAAVPKLPAPSVSRALDAVVIPIDDGVRQAFRLTGKDKGVLVLAVSPKGLAAKNGLKPGDVLRSVKGYAIRKPADVDSVVYYWTTKSQPDFIFDVGRGGRYAAYHWPVTRADYLDVIDVAAISSWESWSVESYSFSYSAYYAEYASAITASYETSETAIEQEASSEAFAAEATQDAADANNDGTPDGLAAAENDGTADDTGTAGEQPGDEGAAASGDDGTDASADDQGGDEAAGTDDGGGDDASVSDDSNGDDGGDDASAEE